jgi:hypothetical protein
MYNMDLVDDASQNGQPVGRAKSEPPCQCSNWKFKRGSGGTLGEAYPRLLPPGS